MRPAIRNALIAAGVTGAAAVLLIGAEIWDGSSRVTSEAQAAVKVRLSDPQSAQFTKVFVVGEKGDRVVCGMVNSRNRMGGYAGPVLFAYQELIRHAVVIDEPWHIKHHTELFGRCGYKP